MSVVDQAAALRGLMDQLDRPVNAGPQATPRPHLAQTIAVTSGKGGVGKTTVSVNLAIQLARLGRRVALLDADLGTANADVICNVAPALTLANVIAGQCLLQDVLIDAPGGFKLVPGASGLASIADLTADERESLNQQLLQLERSFDVLLVDTGAGVGPNVLSFCHAAERVLVVTTPEPTSITDAYAVIKTINAQSPGHDLRLLVNMVRDETEAREVFNRIAAVCQRFLGLSPSFAGFVTSDAQVPLAVRRRHPLVLEAPRSKAGNCLLSLAHRLDRHATADQADRRGLLQRMSFWKRM